MVEAGSSINANQGSVGQDMESDISMPSPNNQESSLEMKKYVAKQIEHLKSEISQYSAKVVENQQKLDEYVHRMQGEINQYKSKVAECQKKLDKIEKVQSLLNDIENSNEENVGSSREQQKPVNETIDLPSTSRNCSDDRNSVRVEPSTSRVEATETTEQNSDNLNNIDYELCSQDFSDNDSLSSYRPSACTQSINLSESQSIEEVNVAKFNLSWEIACQKLLHTLRENKDSYYFREPVDDLAYPDYRKYVTTPMSLREIEDYLKLGEYYKSPIQFSKDMDLIFINSRKYNTDKKSEIYKQTTRLKKLYEDQMKQIISNWKASKNSGAAGASKRKINGIDNGSGEDDDSEIQLKSPSKRHKILLIDDDDDSDDKDTEPISRRLRGLQKKRQNKKRQIHYTDTEQDDDDETESNTEDDETESITEDDDSVIDYSDDDQSTTYEDDYNSASADEEAKDKYPISLTSGSALNEFTSGDRVTVTGKVCKVFKTVKQHSVRKGKNYKLFKFLLKIEDDRNVECVAWEQVADSCQTKIKRNKVFKVGNVKVKFSDGKVYNQGDFGFQLILYDNSTIQCLNP